jgi:hypothetical protein
LPASLTKRSRRMISVLVRAAVGGVSGDVRLSIVSHNTRQLVNSLPILALTHFWCRCFDFIQAAPIRRASRRSSLARPYI